MAQYIDEVMDPWPLRKGLVSKNKSSSENRRICVVQMHYTYIIEHLDDYNAVDKIVGSGLFDEVVIAAADIEENRCLVEWAQGWGVSIRFGSVTNVTHRISEIIDELSATLVLRILPHWYFIDLELVERLIGIVEKEGADYVLLPRDFDIRFGGDVFSGNLLRVLLERFEENEDLSEKYKFNPFSDGIEDVEATYKYVL